MHDVFISYSHKDKHIADGICANLEANGIRCWYAPRDIAPGEEWADAIMKALSKAKVFVLVFSKHSNISPQVKNEITAAADFGCAIVPFRVDTIKMNNGLAYYLNSVHWLDATDKEMVDNIEKLFWIVTDIIKGPRPKPYVKIPVKLKYKLSSVAKTVICAFAIVGVILSALFLFSDKDSSPSTYSAQVGDIVTFGTNEGKPIEWKVLDEDGNRVLVISTEGLFSSFYNMYDGMCTWEACTLRQDLNREFYDLWFTPEEKNSIYETHLENFGNEKFGIDGGSSTRDYLFILSLEELLKYFPEQESRKLKMTGYIGHGESTYFAWWLRNPGRDLKSALYVDVDGYTDYETDINMEMGAGTALQGFFAVRPAMWIKNEFEINEAPTDKAGKTDEDTLKNSQQGDTVKFGSYEQDNNISNGAEDIEWIVLETKDYAFAKELILISKYCLDETYFTSSNYGYDYWYSSIARDWLNNDFYRSAFNEEQRQAMTSITVTTTEYGASAGNEAKTSDMVVFLSLEEYNRYSHISGISEVSATDYLLDKNNFSDGWWLRDIQESDFLDNNYCVTANGEIKGKLQKFAQYARPVIKISIET